MQRNYLSLSLSRAWAMDNPVGDPFGGPAYGERAMPVVAVVAAGMGIATGVGMITAGTAILGSTMLGTVVAGAMIAGGALTIVGTVTDNQKLTKIGNTLSLVGGLSAAAASMTGVMTSTTGLSAGQIAAGEVGTKITVGEASKIGLDKIATGFDSMMGKVGVDTTLGRQTSEWFGATNTAADVAARNAPAETVAPSITATNQYQLGTGPAGSAPLEGVKAEALGMTPAQFTKYQALKAAGEANAYSLAVGGSQSGWTTGEKMMTASMAMQGAGAIMTSQAQEAAADRSDANESARQARIDSIVRVATTKEEFDRYNTTGVAAVYLPPMTPTFAARPPVQAPTTTAQNWNMASMPQQPVVAAVRGAVAPQGFVQAPTFQVPNIG